MNKAKKAKRPISEGLRKFRSIAIALFILIAFTALSLLLNLSHLSLETRTRIGFSPASVDLYPDRTSFVTDPGHLMSDDQVSALDSRFQDFFKKSGVTFYAILLPNLPQGQIEEYSRHLFEYWKPGRQLEDKGLLLVVAAEDRRSRLEVGYGLEGEFPDVLAFRILEQAKENFRANYWAEGIGQILVEIEKHSFLPASGEPPPHRSKSKSYSLESFLAAAWWQKLIGLTIFLGILFALLLAFGPVAIIFLLGWPGAIISGFVFLFAFHFCRGNSSLEMICITFFAFLILLNIAFSLIPKRFLRLNGKKGRSRFGTRPSGEFESSPSGSSSGDFGGRSGGGGASSDW